MGTTGVYESMATVREDLVRQCNYTRIGEKGTVESKSIATKIGRGYFYILFDYTATYYATETEESKVESVRSILCIKMDHKRGCTYYKEMDITVHPYAYDVPLSWLDQVTETTGSALEWIEKARKLANGKKSLAKIELKEGIEFTVNGRKYTLWKPYETVRGNWLIYRDDGCRFRMRVGEIREHLAAMA